MPKMKFKEWLLEMNNVNYDFSSVHIDLPKSLSEEIMSWGKENVHDDDIFVSQEDPSFGREDEIHTTILYGIHSDKPDKVKELLKNEKPIKARLDKIEVFDNPPKFDVVVIKVVSPDLRRLNNLLKENVPYTNKYKSYRPHVTIAYVKKGKGYKHRKVKNWIGKEFTTDYVVFSSKNGTKEKIFLNK